MSIPRLQQKLDHGCGRGVHLKQEHAMSIPTNELARQVSSAPDERSQGRLAANHRLAVIFLAFAPSAQSADNGLRSWTWQFGGAKMLPVGQTVTKRGIF